MNKFKSRNVFNETDFGSVTLTQAQAAEKSPNEGGTAAAQYALASQPARDPRMVIRGESFLNNTLSSVDIDGEKHELFSISGKSFVISTPLPKVDGEPYAAITDYVNFTFPFKAYNLSIIILEISECLGAPFSEVKNRLSGIHGWVNSIQLGETKTIFGYGGQSDTAFLSLPGEACHMVSSWLNLITLIRDKYNGKITRWDGAVDDFKGKYSVEFAVKNYIVGNFNAGGKMPSSDQRGNWLIPDGLGRTFYVGKRENGKMIRIYEKGMQLGAKWHPWVRWELELHSVDRVIPWDVLLEPGKYVAGSYPKVTSWIQDKMQRISTIRNTAQISYDYMTRCTSISYGKHLNVMLQIEGSPEKVLEKLVREGIPKRLDLPIVDENEGWSK
jgi:phage replication initiation protein